MTIPALLFKFQTNLLTVNLVAAVAVPLSELRLERPLPKVERVVDLSA